RDQLQGHLPDAVLPERPGAELGQLAGVVAEAVRREHGEEHVRLPLETRRACTHEHGWAERERDRWSQAVVGAGREEQLSELVERGARVGAGPVADVAGRGRAEMAVEMSRDLVALAIGERDLLQHPANRCRRSDAAFTKGEADVRRAALVPWRVVEV